MSGLLTVRTGASAYGVSNIETRSLEGDDEVTAMPDDNELALRIVRVADSSIHLDWSQYQETPENVYYRVVWSSGAQPAVRYKQAGYL